MKQWIFAVVIAVVAFGVLDGCKQRREIIKQAKLDEEFALRPVTLPNQGEGTLFFHIVNAGENFLGEKRLKLIWGRNPGELNVTMIKLSNMNFVIDEAKETPTARFVFYDAWLDGKVEADAERATAHILSDNTEVPNNGVYGVTIRLNRQQYTEIMLAIVEQK